MRFLEVTPWISLYPLQDIVFTPLEITKTPNFCYFFENLLSYPPGKFKVKTPSPPHIGYPDPSIGGGGEVPILNGMAHFNRRGKGGRSAL
jgi:hypothetical protein